MIRWQMGTEDAGHYIHQHLLPIQRGPLGVGGRDGAVAMQARGEAVAMLKHKLEAVASTLIGYTNL